jgi:hypothetical protein
VTMAGKQVDFPEMQKHVKGLDLWLWVISLVCIALVILAIFLVDGQGGV